MGGLGHAAAEGLGVVVDCGGCGVRGDSVRAGCSHAGGAAGTVPGAALSFTPSWMMSSFSLAGDISEPGFSFWVSGLCNLIWGIVRSVALSKVASRSKTGGAPFSPKSPELPDLLMDWLRLPPSVLATNPDALCILLVLLIVCTETLIN